MNNKHSALPHLPTAQTSPSEIKGWLNHLKVSQKIILGYAAVLGIAVVGTSAGVVIGKNYEREAQEIRDDAVEEIIAFKDLDKTLAQAISHERDLVNWLDTPEQFEIVHAAYEAEFESFQQQWAELMDSYDEDEEEGVEREEEIEIVDTLDESYDDVIEPYFLAAEAIIRQIELQQSDAAALANARQTLIEFGKRPETSALSEFSAQLSLLVEEITEEELEEAEEATEAANSAQLKALSFSIVLSLIAAGILAMIISRAINRPIKAVEEAALSVIREKNFDLRATVVSQDEIGNLAISLNQLIEWVGKHTFALKEAQSELKSQADELNAVIDNLGDGLLVTDAQGRITRSNPALRSMFSLDQQALIGQAADKFFSADISELIAKNQTQPERSLSTDLALPENCVGQALVTAITSEAASTDGGKQSIGSVVLVRDVTAEKAVDQMKTDFISTVSHELRTPLTSVLGFAKLIQKKLEKTVLPAVDLETKKTERAVRQVRENLEIIVSEGERLTSLINDVLDIAKIEAGKIEWNMQPISVSEIIERAIAATSVLSQNSGLKIIRKIDPNLPTVIGDRDRLMQVAINLLSNAIKFTDRGSVTCKAACQDDELTISIIDTGMGLAEDDLEKVFEKFKQVGEVMTDKPKGTGLGLPICKQIIEHHGGRIWAERNAEQGSTFSFTLPLSEPGSAEITRVNLQTLVQQLKENVGRTVAPTDKSQKHILVVDDEQHIRQLLRQELEAEGYQIDEASDGMEAIQKVKEARPDLVIMDVMMPNINGFDLAAVLKNNPDTMDIPTIVLSIIQDTERGYRLGVDRYLSKPIDTALLLKDIKTLLEQGASKRKVLVVDVDTSATKLLADVLLSKGYAVTEASTGPDGIAKALSLKPDMVIVDADISTEHELIKTLRFDKGLENIFFVMLDKDEPSVNSAALPGLNAENIDPKTAEPENFSTENSAHLNTDPESLILENLDPEVSDSSSTSHDITTTN